MNTYNPLLSKGAWLTGALIGGGLAMLASPQTGAYVRSQLRTFASNAGNEILAGAMGRRLNTAIERGIEFAERGQEILRDASRAMDGAIERGKEYLETGRGVVNSRGGQRDLWWQANGFATAGAVVAGILVGGGIALLLTPKSGAEVRDQLRGYAGRVRSYSDKAKGATAMVREK